MKSMNVISLGAAVVYPYAYMEGNPLILYGRPEPKSVRVSGYYSAQNGKKKY